MDVDYRPIGEAMSLLECSQGKHPVRCASKIEDCTRSENEVFSACTSAMQLPMCQAVGGRELEVVEASCLAHGAPAACVFCNTLG